MAESVEIHELRLTDLDKQAVDNNEGVQTRINQVEYVLKETIQNSNLTLRNDSQSSVAELRDELVWQRSHGLTSTAPGPPTDSL